MIMSNRFCNVSEGVDVEISYSYTKAGTQHNKTSDGSVMNFEKGRI